jgi:hypothetical protein
MAQYVGVAGFVQVDSLREASGLARSGRRGDVLWVVNDSGNRPELYAIATNGTHLGTWTVTNAVNEDWEDLALWESSDGPLLVVADVGDNVGVRSQVTIHLIPEPEVAHTGGLARVQMTLHIRYEDGPRDCEAVAVSSSTSELLLLSKRDRPPRLYVVPLVSPRDGPNVTNLVARRCATLSVGPWTQCPDSSWSPLHALEVMPTAMDNDPTGRRLVILTYSDAWVVEFPRDGHWATLNHATWSRCALPSRDAKGPEALRGREAIAWSRDGRTVYVTGERRHPPIWILHVD